MTIEAVVQSAIAISESYLHLDSKNLKVPHTIYLSSKKSDLKIADVSFKSDNNSKTPEWQSSIPLVLKHTLLPTDSIRTDSCRVFKLDVYSPGIEKTIAGEFIIKTNHPDKAEITLRGEITN